MLSSSKPVAEFDFTGGNLESLPQGLVPSSVAYNSITEANSKALAGRRTLLIEDDIVLVRFLQHLLRAEGFDVAAVHTGLDALATLPSGFDLVVLDLNLPDMDGLQLVAEVRAHFPQPSVLVLTGRSRGESAVQALECGADDCLNKPFSHVELLARLRALLRRNQPIHPVRSTSATPLTLHKEALRASREGQAIDLTPREFALLEFLMRSPGQPVSRATLQKEVWGETTAGGGSSNVVDVYMKYLRDKIDLPGKPRLIRTIRGIGYALCTP